MRAGLVKIVEHNETKVVLQADLGLLGMSDFGFLDQYSTDKNPKIVSYEYTPQRGRLTIMFASGVEPATNRELVDQLLQNCADRHRGEISLIERVGDERVESVISPSLEAYGRRPPGTRPIGMYTIHTDRL